MIRRLFAGRDTQPDVVAVERIGHGGTTRRRSKTRSPEIGEHYYRTPGPGFKIRSAGRTGGQSVERRPFQYPAGSCEIPYTIPAKRRQFRLLRCEDHEHVAA